MTKVEKIGTIIYSALTAIKHEEGEYIFDETLAETINKDASCFLWRARITWEKQEHGGDCTNSCQTCDACFYKDEIIDVGNKYGLIFKKSKAYKQADKIEHMIFAEMWEYWWEGNIPEQKPRYFTECVKWAINQYNELT